MIDTVILNHFRKLGLQLLFEMALFLCCLFITLELYFRHLEQRSLFVFVFVCRPYLEAVFNALECTENDYEALFALCLLYAMGHNDGRSPHPITPLLTLSYIYHTLEPFISETYTCPDKWNILDYQPKYEER